MPTYNYQCPKCKRILEMKNKVSNRHVAPMCCNDGCNIDMELIISKTSFTLKGSGWAKDGYTRDKK